MNRGAACEAAECIFFPAVFVLGATPAAESGRAGGAKMKGHLVIAVAAGVLLFASAVSAQNRATVGSNGAPAPDAKAQGGCVACAQKVSAEAVSSKPIMDPLPETVSVQLVPGTNESMLVGRIENLMPIGVLAVLGCETCTGEAVTWALQQGSSTGDVERALHTIETMQKLDCFKHQFGPDAAVRLEKPLAAARKVLQQAIDRAKK